MIGILSLIGLSYASFRVGHGSGYDKGFLDGEINQKEKQRYDTFQECVMDGSNFWISDEQLCIPRPPLRLCTGPRLACETKENSSGCYDLGELEIAEAITLPVEYENYSNITHRIFLEEVWITPICRNPNVPLYNLGDDCEPFEIAYYKIQVHRNKGIEIGSEKIEMCWR